MKPQPLIIVTLIDNSKIMLNEAHVVSVAKIGEAAMVNLSNGDVLTVISPSYDEWENDVHSRKY
jgi:hypothetical protein